MMVFEFGGVKLKLNGLTERIWVYHFEKERDRPNLSYIRGDRWSMAVDAGHSENHTRDFYQALEAEGLPLPALTVLTHWHWDHTLGMHAVHGLCLANSRTNQLLADFRNRLETEGTSFFFAMDETIRCEYADGQPVIVTLADLVFQGEMKVDAGNCPIRIFQAESPHTDDSTLIYVPGEKVLILGDSTSGTFPEWTMDPGLAEKMVQTIQDVNPEICLHSHLEALPAKKLIREYLL